MNITGPASERGEDAGKDWGMEGPMTRADVSVCVCVGSDRWPVALMLVCVHTGNEGSNKL